MPDLNEAKTRASLIDPQLEKAGWNLSDRSQVRFEVPVIGYDTSPWNGFTDYCLYHPDGSVLAVIEAKRTSRNAREGEEQLRQYVNEIAAKQNVPPFGFMTNGLHYHFWEVGLACAKVANPRECWPDCLSPQSTRSPSSAGERILDLMPSCPRSRKAIQPSTTRERFAPGRTLALRNFQSRGRNGAVRECRANFQA